MADASILHRGRDLLPGPSGLSELVAAVLAESIDIRSLWSLDHDAADTRIASAPLTLLVFASEATLQRLKRRPWRRDAITALLVVTDGDFFQAACGSGISGSLARWCWRQSSPGEAFYDQTRWNSDEGGVVRVRRKALLLWQVEKT
jgi:hypothetical protein